MSARKAKDGAIDRALARLAAVMRPARSDASRAAGLDADMLSRLAAADLIMRGPDGGCELTKAGRARLARRDAANRGADIDPFRGQHLALSRRRTEGPVGASEPLGNDAESPLAWLARRKGKDGRPMIEPAQFAAGERLRADFTFAQMTPRMTVDWSSPLAGGAGAAAGGPSAMTDAQVAARQRLARALDAVGAEFAGLLVDVCCFLKGLEDIERERGWPPRSAKVVLQLGLDRLARHYGLAAAAQGPRRAQLRTWLAPGERFVVAGE